MVSARCTTQYGAPRGDLRAGEVTDGRLMPKSAKRGLSCGYLAENYFSLCLELVLVSTIVWHDGAEPPDNVGKLYTPGADGYTEFEWNRGSAGNTVSGVSAPL